jgi:hypothetical protein
MTKHALDSQSISALLMMPEQLEDGGEKAIKKDGNRNCPCRPLEVFRMLVAKKELHVDITSTDTCQ